jgi:hypothetical protein
MPSITRPVPVLQASPHVASSPIASPHVAVPAGSRESPDAARSHSPLAPHALLDRIIATPRALYWSMQLGGWGAFGLSTFLTLLAWTPPGQRWPLFLAKIVRAGLGFAASLVLTRIYGTLRRRQTSAWRAVPIALASCLVLGTLWTLAYRGVVAPGLLYSPPMFNTEVLPRAALDLIFVLIAWSALYAGLVAWREAQEAAREREAARRLASEARYRMLSSQLDPHFLFNALNSIRALTDEDPPRAGEMITGLSELLRASLTRDALVPATVAEEIGFVQQYLALERVRFESRLHAVVEVDPRASDALVPPILIQPLVENAMKHGVADAAGCRHVIVTVSEASGRLSIVVSNRGSLAVRGAAPQDTGIGLASIRERLAVLHPGAASFRLREQDGWVHAEVDLPLQPPNAGRTW